MAPKKRPDRKSPARKAVRETSNPKYHVGGSAPDGSKIDEIYGETKTVLVFRRPDNSVGYWVGTDELSKKDLTVLQKYDSAQALGLRVYPKTEWNWLSDQLGSALFNGLSDANADEAIKAFDALTLRILTKGKNDQRLIYLLAATGAAIILGIVTLVFYHVCEARHRHLYAACMISAIGGAFASVIIRTSSVEIDPTEPRGTVLLRGVFRIILGGLLAAFLIAAAKANLVAGIAVTNFWSFITFSFLAGFSERFVPEILATLDQKKEKSATKEK